MLGVCVLVYRHHLMCLTYFAMLGPVHFTSLYTHNFVYCLLGIPLHNMEPPTPSHIRGMQYALPNNAVQCVERATKGSELLGLLWFEARELIERSTFNEISMRRRHLLLPQD